MADIQLKTSDKSVVVAAHIWVATTTRR